jgi:hypothetical protein
MRQRFRGLPFDFGMLSLIHNSPLKRPSHGFPLRQVQGVRRGGSVQGSLIAEQGFYDVRDYTRIVLLQNLLCTFISLHGPPTVESRQRVRNAYPSQTTFSRP